MHLSDTLPIPICLHAGYQTVWVEPKPPEVVKNGVKVTYVVLTGNPLRDERCRQIRQFNERMGTAKACTCPHCSPDTSAITPEGDLGYD